MLMIPTVTAVTPTKEILTLADHFQRYRGYQLNLLIPKKSGTPDGARSFFFIIFYFNVRNRFAFLSAGRSAM